MFRKVPLENRFEYSQHRRLGYPVYYGGDDGFIMHLPLIALRIRHGFGLKYARALEAFVRLFY
jgi:hypothetical protein